MQRVALYVTAVLAACPFIDGCVPVGPTGAEDGGRSGDLVVWPSESLDEIEPNDGFATAMPVAVSDSIRIAGQVDSNQDSDVYTLGSYAMSANLRCTIESGAAGELSVCLFDEQERLLCRSSVVNPESPRTFEILLPEPVQNLYLLTSVVSGDAPQPYWATISVQPEPGVLAYRPQVVLLNFDGGEDITVAGRLYEKLPTFDAASIDARYEGKTGEIIEMMLQRVRADFQGLDVLIYLASDPLVPPGPYSIVHFGSANPDLLGVADGVDPYNARVSESAIIYTDTFSLFAALEPDEEALAQVLANVTSHELGHLLGLRHTDDQNDLMDVTATARRLMHDQGFRKSPLHSSVSPLGCQDSPAMLAWAVGGRLMGQPPPSKAIILAKEAGDFEIPRSMLCSHCSEPLSGVSYPVAR